MTPPAATTAGRTLGRGPAQRAPRRVSGPARPKGAPRPGSTPRRTDDPFVLRAARRGRNVADSRFLDRLVRGRLWIPIVAAALMGIVFMQVSMLKLNSGISRSVQSAQTLERANQGLRAEVSRMESGSRIQDVARKLGMVVPTAGSFHYLQAGDATTARRAADGMTPAGTDAILRTRAAEAAALAAAAATANGAGAGAALAAGTAAAATTAGTAAVQLPGAAATTATSTTPAPAQTPAPTVVPGSSTSTAPPTAGGTTGTTAGGTSPSAGTATPPATTAAGGATAAPVAAPIAGSPSTGGGGTVAPVAGSQP